MLTVCTMLSTFTAMSAGCANFLDELVMLVLRVPDSIECQGTPVLSDYVISVRNDHACKGGKYYFCFICKVIECRRIAHPSIGNPLLFSPSKSSCSSRFTTLGCRFLRRRRNGSMRGISLSGILRIYISCSFILGT